MCLILTAYKAHPQYDLIILANRDEFYARPTESAHWWEEATHILAGKDLKAGGTWLGVTKDKQFSALTNFRDPSNFRPDAKSRGDLVINYLKEQEDICQYGSKYLADVSAYNDFNMIFYEDETLYYYASRKNEIEELDPGIYGLSNHILNTPWPKVANGISELETLINDNNLNVDSAFDLLSNKTTASDSKLPSTGVTLEIERSLSAMHIDIPGYGTRSSNVVLFSKEGEVVFNERNHLAGTKKEFRF